MIYREEEKCWNYGTFPFELQKILKDKEKGILENVSFTLEDNRFVAITGRMEAENQHLQKLLQELKSLLRDRFY